MLAEAEVNIRDDSWHHVAVTVGPRSGQDTITLYVDGEAVGSAPNEVTMANEGNETPIKIGYCIQGFPPGQSGFKGVIDDIRWFKYAIGADKVKRIFEGDL